jgi:hypothetical protein
LTFGFNKDFWVCVSQIIYITSLHIKSIYMAKILKGPKILIKEPNFCHTLRKIMPKSGSIQDLKRGSPSVTPTQSIHALKCVASGMEMCEIGIFGCWLRRLIWEREWRCGGVAALGRSVRRRRSARHQTDTPPHAGAAHANCNSRLTRRRSLADRLTLLVLARDIYLDEFLFTLGPRTSIWGWLSRLVQIAAAQQSF